MKNVGIYIHVPFCRGKCPYCDFYSVTARDSLMDDYTDETVRRVKEFAGRGYAADTVYFGGGTPSLLGGGRIARIMEEIGNCFDIPDGAEITAEANPSGDIGEFIEGCAAAGINRLSLGMQSALRKELCALGRRHSTEEVLTVMEKARRAGIDNISLDLMLGIPFQTADSLETSLRFIENTAPSHVSAYMLKIEENTPFYRIRHALDIAGENELADMYLQTFDSLDRMGYHQYEISNTARRGCESRHNLKYWNCGEYIGIGPAAHGFLDGRRYHSDRSLESYLAGEQPRDDGEGGSVEEYIMLRLRLSEGLTESGMKEKFGAGIPDALRKKAALPIMAQYCVCDRNGIRLTRKGMLVSNAIICELAVLL